MTKIEAALEQLIDAGFCAAIHDKDICIDGYGPPNEVAGAKFFTVLLMLDYPLMQWHDCDESPLYGAHIFVYIMPYTADPCYMRQFERWTKVVIRRIVRDLRKRLGFEAKMTSHEAWIEKKTRRRQ